MTDPTAALAARLDARLDGPAAAWLAESVTAVRDDPTAVRTRFPAAGRRVGRALLDPAADPGDPFAPTVDEAARVRLLAACGDAAADELDGLYRFGDAAERRAVLRALDVLEVPAGVGRALV
jgi:hypothetical protein